MIGGAVGQAARLGVAGEMRLADQARVDNVRGLLQRQIEGALPLPSGFANDQAGIAFAGGAATFAFAARRPAQLLPGGVHLARFDLLPPEKSGAGGALQASWRLIDPARPPGGQDSRIETVRLLDGIGGFRLRYFGRKASGAVGWHEDWRGEPRLPSLISLDMEPTTAAGWRWPPLVAAPRIATLPTLTAPKNPLAASKGPAHE